LEYLAIILFIILISIDVSGKNDLDSYQEIKAVYKEKEKPSEMGYNVQNS